MLPTVGGSTREGLDEAETSCHSSGMPILVKTIPMKRDCLGMETMMMPVLGAEGNLMIPH